MAAFGEVTMASERASAASADPNPQPTNGVAHDSIDPNDPRLVSEQLNENPQGDAYATPPPLPDGKWRAKAKQVDIKNDKGELVRYAAFSRAKMANGQPFLATNVEFTVLTLDDRYTDSKLTEYWVKTLVERSGASQISTLLTKFKQPLAPGSQQNRMEQFLRVLAAEPELVIETAWEASCMNCQEAAKKSGNRTPKPFLLGSHRFPQVRLNGTVQPDPVTQCPNCKSPVRAQARIVNFFPLVDQNGKETPHNK